MRRGRWLALPAIAALLVVCPGVVAATDDAASMVEDLRARGIRDERVLDAFRRVRRETFVPDDERDRAYDDSPLPIGHGQTISQPYMVALMTELLQLRGGERVLEIGTGSGYQAAVLAVIAREVYSIEIIPALATSARLRLTREGYRNVHVKLGDGALGWREYGPYDAIVVTAAAPTVPRPLIQQLKEGGVLVMPLGERQGRQVLVRGVMRAGKLRTREITDVRFVPMTGEGVRPRPPERDRGAQDERLMPEPPERDRGARDERLTPEPPERDQGLRDERLAPEPPERDQGLRDERLTPEPPERDQGIREERLRDQDEDDPESDTRFHLRARTPIARAPAARAYDRPYASDAGVAAGAGSPGEARPTAG